MSYISELKRFYPRTYKARYAINAYNTHKYFEHEDPTVITIHETTLNYGGPEEGNWYTRSKASPLLEIQRLAPTSS